MSNEHQIVYPNTIIGASIGAFLSVVVFYPLLILFYLSDNIANQIEFLSYVAAFIFIFIVMFEIMKALAILLNVSAPMSKKFIETSITIFLVFITSILLLKIGFGISIVFWSLGTVLMLTVSPFQINRILGVYH
jgi:hypothetical protein